MTDCIFCEKIKQSDGVFWNFNKNRIIQFEPLNPVVQGHRLFVHETHTVDASDDPTITGEVFAVASCWAKVVNKPFNLITSGGSEATQTVFHTHIHYVPREENDGLHLPWTGQKKLELDVPQYDYLKEKND